MASSVGIQLMSSPTMIGMRFVSKPQRRSNARLKVVQVLQVNLNTVFTLCRDVGAYMLTRTPKGPTISGILHRGSIINIASLVSFQGGLNVPAYASAKGGVAQLTKALSNQWASQGINVNAVSSAAPSVSAILRCLDCTRLHPYGYE